MRTWTPHISLLIGRHSDTRVERGIDWMRCADVAWSFAAARVRRFVFCCAVGLHGRSL